MAAAKKQTHYVGVDLGGTKILTGVYDQDLKFLGKMKLSTKADRDYPAIVDRIARCVKEAIDECDLGLKQILALGIGAPAAVDPEAGLVLNAPNLKWRDKPLQKDLEKALGIPVTLENDCNACTLGVHELELEGKPRHMVGIFLGTGIGGGIIIDGRLYSGFNRTAGEIGHMVMDLDGPKSNWGPRGTYEALAGRQYLFGRLREAIAKGKKTDLTDVLGPELTDLRSGDLRKAIKRGDKLVGEIVHEAARCTGVVVGNMINLLNPEVVALGGGLIEALGKEMMPIILKTAPEHALPGTEKGIRIIESKLGDHAGIAGAAVLARKSVS